MVKACHVYYGKIGDCAIIKRYKGMPGNLNLWLTVMDEEPADTKKIEEVPVELRKKRKRKKVD